jgi:6-phospho-3-hexuloisomerase
MSIGKEVISYTARIVAENQTLSGELLEGELTGAIERIQGADRLFFMGLGRSGLALKMVAMRFMHLGLNVYVAGEVVTPAIAKGDLLIVASGSGSTTSVLNAVGKAKAAGANILGVTAEKGSKLAQEADQLLCIPAASKTDFSDAVSKQYAGSLFEQFVLLLFDAMFMKLWQDSGKTKEELWPKHANLE